MAFDIREIKASLDQHSYLRTHSYDIQMNTPPVLQNERLSIVNELSSQEIEFGIGDMPRMIRVRAEEAQLPGAMIMVSDNQRYGIGPHYKNPNNILFTDTSLTFIADKYGLLWAYFYLWKNKIFTWSQKLSGEGAAVPNYNLEYRKVKQGGILRNNYVTDIDITAYDVENIPRMKFKLFEAYPVIVPSTPMAWGQNDQLLKLHVSFTFQRWEMMNISTNDSAMNPLPTTTEQWNSGQNPSPVSAETPSTDFTTP